MTSAPFRDQFAFVRQFEQHVGIALALLEQFEGQIATDMLHASRETAEGAEVYERARRTWQDIWQQLEQARDLAQGAGRSVVDAHDVFAAASIWSVDGPMRREHDIAVGNRRILKRVTFRSTDLVRSAVAALATAVPEAVLAAPPPIVIPDGWFVRWGWAIALFVLFMLIGLCAR
jgi:hypothetical protein